MGIVGNPTDARLIFNAVDDYRSRNGGYFYDLEDAAPEGWEYLGEGMYRAAFRSPDGVCYKVEKNPRSGYGQTNYEEFVNYVEMALHVTMPEGSRLPAYTFYEVGEYAGYGGRAYKLGVSAMECVNGKTLSEMEEEDEEGPDDYGMMLRINRACRLSDIHSGNVMYDGTDYILVDIGA